MNFKSFMQRKYREHKASIAHDHRAYFLNWATFGLPGYMLMISISSISGQNSDGSAIPRVLHGPFSAIAGLWILSAVSATLAAIESPPRRDLLAVVGSQSFIAGYRVMVVSLVLHVTLQHISLDIQWWMIVLKLLTFPIVVGCWFAFLDLITALYTGATAFERYIRMPLSEDAKKP